MGIGHIFDTFNDYYSKLNQHFNFIGKFYLKFQLLCRVLVVEIFLDDLFDEPELTCETDQIGCELTCINRFAPISHMQLWQFELMTIFFGLFVFIIFNFWNQSIHKKYVKKIERQEFSRGLEKNFEKMGFYKEITPIKNKDGAEGEEEDEKEKPIKSNVTTTGYILMLVLRLIIELGFMVLEASLAKHHSQNAEIQDYLHLKESWMCPTNDDHPGKIRSVNELLPISNRSALFHRLDPNMACIQQQVTVTCWIPFSRMKSLGMQFMYAVLVFQTFLTVSELIFEFLNTCRRRTKISVLRSEYKRSMSSKYSVGENKTI